MVAEARIELSRREGVLMAPARAVVMGARTDREREASVFVAVAEHAARRTVRIGRRYGERIEIEEGLEEGEVVIVEGHHLLRDGSAIRTREAPGEAEVDPEPDSEPTPTPETETGDEENSDSAQEDDTDS